MNMNQGPTFPLSRLKKVPPQVPGESPETWINRVAEANLVLLQSRVDVRALWRFATNVVHPPYRWKEFIDVKPGEPDPEQVEAWRAWVRQELAMLPAVLHADCCLAHGCKEDSRYCPVLKHFVQQRERCSICPTAAEISRGDFNDADVSVLEEWGVISPDASRIYDEMWLARAQADW